MTLCCALAQISNDFALQGGGGGKAERNNARQLSLISDGAKIVR